MSTRIHSKAIVSVLFLAGFASKSDLAGASVAQAVKNYKNGNVVAVLDTVSVLTKDTVNFPRNKASAENLTEKMRAASVGIKSNFKGFGFAIALCQLAEQGADETGCALLAELAKAEASELQKAYQASKPVKVAKATNADTTIDAAIDAAIATNADADTSVSSDAAFQQVLSALQAGLLTSNQVECLRIALHMLDDSDTAIATPANLTANSVADSLATVTTH